MTVIVCATFQLAEVKVSELAETVPSVVSLLLIPASRVVQRLQGPVATPRSEAGVIVTERGAADLRGCGLRERERRMRAIASASS